LSAPCEAGPPDPIWPKALAVAAALLVFALPAQAEQIERNLSAVDLFRIAGQAQAAGRTADAEALYSALEHDPDAEIRAEARFRHGMMLAALKRNREAAVLFRALLDEEPAATRVRLELARVLAAMGDEGAARRELRQAEAAGLPPDVALVVDQFANALRSSRRVGGSVGLALAPDSNINRATSARTLDTVIAPLTLSEDARERSGLGLQGSAQAYLRLPLGSGLAVVPRLSGQGDLYRQSQFDDVSGSALLGLEWRLGKERIGPSVGQTWRWYGGALYARTQTVTLDWIHPAGERAQLEVRASAARARYVKNPLQDGQLYAWSASYERALTPSLGVGFTLDGGRQTARDPGYATWSGGASVLAWRDVGRTSLFGSAGLHRLEGDARLFLFPERRREWLYQASLGATFRTIQWHGFAPVLRLTWEQNRSTVGLYDYRRIATTFGIARAF
jgi:hypothetical protein